MRAFIDNASYEFKAYIDSLVEKHLYPFRKGLKGSYKMEGLNTDLNKVTIKAFELSGIELKSDEKEEIKEYKSVTSIKELAKSVAEKLNDTIEFIFKQVKNSDFYIFDFSCLTADIENKLMELTCNNMYFTKNIISINTNEISQMLRN